MSNAETLERESRLREQSTRSIATRRPVRLGRPSRQRRKRIQLDLLEQVFARVVAVQHVTHLESTRAVFREAFRLFEWYTRKRSEGWKIQLVNDAGQIRDVEFLDVVDQSDTQ